MIGLHAIPRGQFIPPLTLNQLFLLGDGLIAGYTMRVRVYTIPGRCRIQRLQWYGSWEDHWIGSHTYERRAQRTREERARRELERGNVELSFTAAAALRFQQ